MVNYTRITSFHMRRGIPVCYHGQPVQPALKPGRAFAQVCHGHLTFLVTLSWVSFRGRTQDQHDLTYRTGISSIYT